MGRSLGLAALTGAFLLLALAIVQALQWQREEAAKTGCLTNERRLATALLLYGQDHDGRLPPPEYRLPDDTWRHWLDILRPYISQEEITTCPSNPVEGAVEPFRGYSYSSGYALNCRFYNVFDPGPFPIENLELPAQTVLLVEGGSFPLKQISGVNVPGLGAMSLYTDTAEWPFAYRSPHKGRMNVVAADGHTVSLKIAHYTPTGHEARYGRLGGSIYNWNGGHPNGDTGGPPRE